MAAQTLFITRYIVAGSFSFKYKPRVIDGQPIEVPGVPYKLTFELED